MRVMRLAVGERDEERKQTREERRKKDVQKKKSTQKRREREKKRDRGTNEEKWRKGGEAAAKRRDSRGERGYLSIGTELIGSSTAH